MMKKAGIVGGAVALASAAAILGAGSALAAPAPASVPHAAPASTASIEGCGFETWPGPPFYVYDYNNCSGFGAMIRIVYVGGATSTMCIPAHTAKVIGIAPTQITTAYTYATC
jgi:hypothetical protein